jgi:cellulose biosynthesis protein BcsQ
LKKKISEIEWEYDYIFYDLPPSSSKIIQNAWIASDYLMIPVSDTFSLEWTDLLLNTMINIKKEHNPDLKFIFFLNKVKLHSNKTWEHLWKHHYKIMTLLSDALDSNEDLSSMAYMMNSWIRYSMSVETWILDENIRGDYKSVANELDKLIKNN